MKKSRGCDNNKNRKLFIKVLGDAVIKSECMNINDIITLSLVGKDVCHVVRETTRTIKGDARTLSVFPLFKSVRGLHVTFKLYYDGLLSLCDRKKRPDMTDIAFKYAIDKRALQGGIDLSSLHTLTVHMDNISIDNDSLPKRAMARNRDVVHESKYSLIRDPLTEVVIPGLSGAKNLSSLSLYLDGHTCDGINQVITMAPFNNALKTLTISSSSHGLNELVATVWSSVQQGYLHNITSLSIESKCLFPRNHASFAPFIKGISSKNHLPGLRNLTLLGAFVETVPVFFYCCHGSSRHPLSCIHEEKLDLFHLDKFIVNDPAASYAINCMLTSSQRSLAYTMMASSIAEWKVPTIDIQTLVIAKNIICDVDQAIADTILTALLIYHESTQEYWGGTWMACLSEVIACYIGRSPRMSHTIYKLIIWYGKSRASFIHDLVIQDIGSKMLSWAFNVVIRNCSNPDICERDEDGIMTFIYRCLSITNCLLESGGPTATLLVLRDTVDVWSSVALLLEYRNRMTPSIRSILWGIVKVTALLKCPLPQDISKRIVLPLMDNRPDMLRKVRGTEDVVAEELSRCPKRFKKCPSDILWYVTGGLKNLHSPSQYAERVFDRLMIPERWDGFWCSMMKYCQDSPRELQLVLYAAMKRNHAAPPSPLLLPPGLKKIVMGWDFYRLTLDICQEFPRWLVLVFWAGSIPEYIYDLIGRNRTTTLSDDLMEHVIKVWVVLGGCADDMIPILKLE